MAAAKMVFSSEVPIEAPSCWPTRANRHRARHQANRAAEDALAIAEQDRVVLPFAMTTGSAELLEALPRHETAHAALLADILDLVHGSSLAAKIAGELSVSPNTVSTHIRSSTPSSVPPIAPRRSVAPANCGSSQPPGCRDSVSRQGNSGCHHDGVCSSMRSGS